MSNKTNLPQNDMAKIATTDDVAAAVECGQGGNATTVSMVHHIHQPA